MTAVPLPPESRPPAPAGETAKPVVLTEGQAFAARVVGSTEDGRFTLAAAGRRFSVEAPVALQVGQEVTLTVVKGGEQPVFKLATAAPTAAVRSADTAVLDLLLQVDGRPAEVLSRLAGAVSDGQSVGVATAEEGLAAVHLPDGTVLAVTPASPSESSPAPQLPAETVAQVRAVVLSISASGAEQGIRVEIPLAQLRELAAALQSSSGAPVTLEVTGDGSAVLRLGELGVPVRLPSSALPPAGDLLQTDAASVMLRLSVTTGEGTAPMAVGDGLDALLGRAGLSPSPETRAVAAALIDHGLPVTREHVQALLALGAGREGPARQALLEAGAALLSKDIPLAPALAAGHAASDTGAPLAELLGQAVARLEQTAQTQPQLAQPLQEAASLVRGLNVVLESASQARTDLAAFFREFGRVPLAEAAARVESAVTSHLSQSPLLRNLDAALGPLLNVLQAQHDSIVSGQPAASDVAGPAASAGSAVEPVPPSAEAASTLPVDVDAVLLTVDADGLVLLETSAGDDASGLPEQIRSAASSPLPGSPEPAAGLIREGVRLAHPGIGPEVLPPVSRVELTEAQAKVVADLVRSITEASSPEEALRAAERIVRTADRTTLRAVAAELEYAERQALRQDPTVERLSETADLLRDMGRRFVSQKAENLAGARQDPGVFVAEVPFRAGREDGSGKLQVFYRKQDARGGRKGTTAHVTLNLHTTNLGQVLGDMRLLRKDLQIRLSTATQDAADQLASEADVLSRALAGLGFSSSIRFVASEPSQPSRLDSVAERIREAGRLDVEA